MGGERSPPSLEKESRGKIGSKSLDKVESLLPSAPEVSMLTYWLNKSLNE